MPKNNSVIQDDGILVIPTSINLPPKLESKEIYSEEYMIQATTLSSLATMSGCCQVIILSLSRSLLHAYSSCMHMNNYNLF